MTRAAFVLLLALAGCTPEAGDNPTERQRALAREAQAIEAGVAWHDSVLAHATAFDPGPAQPDSGVLHFMFTVPTYDHCGPCGSGIRDSTYPGDALWCRAFREWVDDAGVGHSVADSFPVRRGETVTYWRRVEPDSFLCNFRLYKGTKGGCRVYRSQIVPASNLPAPELLP